MRFLESGLAMLVLRSFLFFGGDSEEQRKGVPASAVSCRFLRSTVWVGWLGGWEVTKCYELDKEVSETKNCSRSEAA